MSKEQKKLVSKLLKVSNEIQKKRLGQDLLPKRIQYRKLTRD